MDRFEKLRASVRYRLQGMADIDPSYFIALHAYDLAESKHHGVFRKDGTTPEFMHPLEVTGYLFTLGKNLQFRAETFAAGLLHDVGEDYGVTFAEVEDGCGRRTAHAFRRLSKKLEGAKVTSLQDYFDAMLDCPVATVVKGADRINNQSTMTEVFSPTKQLEYVDESEKFILPMLKKARRLYPEQEAAYENIKVMLKNQIALVRAMHG